MTIFKLLEKQADCYPINPAITAPDRSAMSYGELVSQIQYTVNFLCGIGVKRNDRVAVVLPDGPEMAVTFLGVSSCATSAPLNSAYNNNELDVYLTDLGIKYLIVQSGVDSAARKIATEKGITVVELLPDLDRNAGAFTLTSNLIPDDRCKANFAHQDDIALVLHTSGTTALPKVVPLTHYNICTSVDYFVKAYKLDKYDCCLNIMPLFHISGLIGSLLCSLAAGGKSYCCPKFSEDKFYLWMKDANPTWYMAAPTMHQAILSRAEENTEIIKTNTLRFIRSASSFLPEQVQVQLEDKFQTPVLVSYGMTETALHMSNNPLPPGKRKQGSVGPASGPEMAIMDDSGKLLTANNSGEIVARGDNVIRGYENNPEENRKTFTNGWFRTGDQGYLDDEGYLFITGRIKEIINKGGEKISPAEIDKYLLEHPEISQAVVFAMPHPTLEQDIGAAVVLKKGSYLTEKDVREFCFTQLAEFKVPSQIIILDEIPKSKTGKYIRLNLFDTLASKLKVDYVAPRDQLENTLSDIYSDVLKREYTGINDNFFSNGGDSLSAAQVVSRIRARLNVDLPIVDLFRKPTVIELAEVIRTTSSTDDLDYGKLISRVDRSKSMQLTFPQRSLWFIDGLSEKSSAYNILSAARLQGELDPGLLQKSFELLMQRHEILRSNYVLLNDEPVIKLRDNNKVQINIVDISNFPDRESSLEKELEVESSFIFDLASSPLLRVKLIIMDESEAILMINIHHIISDGWSMSILRREISTIYNSLLRNEDHGLAEHKIQFVDYAQWQIAQQDTEIISNQLKFWQQRLSSAPELFELPYKCGRSDSVSGKESVQRFSLSDKERRALMVLSEKHQVTLFVTLLSVFNILLSTYSGRKDIIVGAPVAGRNNYEIEDLIGYFVNTVILRTDLAGITDFSLLLAHVKDRVLEALSNQDVSFEKVVDRINPDRYPGINPIYQVMFVLQNTPKNNLELQDIVSVPVKIKNTASKLDLSLDVTDNDQCLEFELSYNSSLFEDVMISKMLEHYEAMLHEIINNPNNSISKIVSSTLPEREMILYDWNETDKDLLISNTFYREFERQVEETPDHIAVVINDEKLSYSQLNTKANQLANYLVSIGVRPKQPVVLCMDRSLDTIVAVLSIMKAGCYYVPTDPDYPQSRLHYIADDVKAGFVLTQSQYKRIFQKDDLVAICIDEIRDQISKEHSQNLKIDVAPDDLIYIIYTSGTTGNPKGVMIEHRSVLNLVYSYYEELFKKINKKDMRVSLNAPLVFDASVQQLGMLLYGYTLYMVPEDVRHDIDDFIDFICTNSLNALDFVPSQFQLMLDGGLLDKWKNEDSIILIGGEAISEKMWQQLVNNKEIIFYNTYGPTECTVDSARYLINGSAHGPVIGRPIDNYKLFILDNDCNPVPAGIPGELHVGGVGVARGYLNRPELTKEKFISNPFSGDENDRLYKTGDLVRYLHDGNIEYLGRIDHQVKIRGYRIELGEIESNLQGHSAVRQALVEIYENDSGNKIIVAYIVRSEDTRGDNPDYVSFLKKKLPDYMVPVTYVHIDKIPLTKSGKVDKKSLPKPDLQSVNEEHYQPAETETETALVGIWEEVLGITKVGILDNFFSLGGHSLLATRMLSRIKTKTGVKLTLKTLFLGPVIKDLAKLIESDNKSLPLSNETKFDKNADAFPLSSAQKRLWFVNQLYPDDTAYNLSTIWKINGDLSITAIEMAVADLVQKHSILRTVIKENEDSEPRQYVKEFSNDYFCIVKPDVRPVTESSIIKQVNKDVCLPYDFENGPLVRFNLYEVNKQEYVFSVCMHHIISDAWSMNLLFDELAKSYNVIQETGAGNIEALPLQYNEYSYRQHQSLGSGEVVKQLQYWEEKLSGYTPLEIAGQLVKHERVHETAKDRSIVLDKNVLSGIKYISELHDVSMFIVFLSIFNVLSHRLSRQDDFTIGAPVVIRDSEELEKLIGLFLNNVVLRFDMSDDPTFPDILARVKDVVLEAFDNLDVPYDQVVERLVPGQSFDANPFFNVLFNYIPEAEQGLVLNGLECRSLGQPEKGVRFGLTLYMEEFSDCVKVRLNYSPSRFRDSEIENILQSFKFLIDQIIESSDLKIRDYSLVTEKARKLLPDITERLESAKLETVISQFDKAAEAYPENISVEKGTVSWSYRDLKNRSEDISRALLAKGLMPGDVVAIIGQKGFSVIASMLGVLRSGGVTLTIDDYLPEERKALMINETNAQYIIAAGENKHTQKELEGEKYLYIDSVDAALYTADDVISESSQLPDINLESPAYIFFTSGSTGKPKAILGSHKGLAHFIQWQGDTFKITAEDRVSQLTSLTFDVILRDVFLPLTRGACSCIPQDDDYEILPWIEENGLTVMHTVPGTMVSRLQVSQNNYDFSKLRYMFFSGEALNGALINKLKQRCNGEFRIINLYGPTETTMVKSWYEVPVNHVSATQSIGVPLPNTQFIVLGKGEQICGINEPGEIAIRTPYRTLGYINDASNTDKFITNPFNDDEDDVVYLTGDLGRIRPDGLYEYLGRVDDQIKINGVRIEPAEVSAVISNYSDINSSYVNSIKLDGVDKLVAYIIGESGKKPLEQDIKEYLRLYLPEVMVPKAFIFLEAFPLLTSGKVDRKKLPKPVFNKVLLADYVEPQTDLQKDLVAIWSELLNKKQVGVRDNFFDLGGHSLLAVQVMSRISRKVNYRIPLRLIFTSPQIESLSKAIEELLSWEYKSENIIIEKQPRDRDFPLTYMQSTLWLHDKLVGGSSAYNIPVAYNFSGALNVNVLKQSFMEIISRHESLRTIFQESNGTTVQVVKQTGELDFIYEVNLSETIVQSEVINNFLDGNVNYKFDLKKSPLLRINLLKLKEDQYVLLVNVHHIIFDGWSWGVFLAELEEIYNSISSNEKYHLGEPKIHLVDFAVWQRNRVNSPGITSQVEYWKNKLENLPDNLSLPAKRANVAVTTNIGESEKILLPLEFVDSLNSVCSKENVTLFMLFLSAYYVLLRRYSNQEDIVIGTPVSGRNTKELEGLIGFFINILAIRISPDGNISYKDLLHIVRDIVLDAFEHQDLPIEKVSEIVNAASNGGFKSTFHAMFVFQNFSQSALALNNVESTRINIEKTTSKVDFSMVINRKGNGLEAMIEYNPDIFEKSTIQSMLKSYKVLLDGIKDRINDKITGNSLLKNEDLNRILVEWNDTHIQYPVSQGVHDLFHKQAEKTPGSIAVRFENQEITYKELENKSSKLANYLIGSGVQSEDIVALCIDSSVEMVISVLGIIKSGGAYLPIDPAYPDERKKYLMADSGCKYLITKNNLLGDIPLPSTVVFNLDVNQSDLEKMPAVIPEVKIRPTSLAYVIYTSGSTGNPKGVLIEHKGLCNLALAQIKAFGVSSESRILQAASFSFDASVSEIFMALLSGATLVMAPKIKLYPGPELVNLLNNQKITTVTLIPSSLARLPEDRISYLQNLIVAGESGSQDLLTKWAGKLNLHNAYGPTEGTVCTTIASCISGLEPTVIGRPMDNVKVYILDSNSQPVPIGVSGELHIGGIGLARGYLNRPELTREKFISNPFSASDESRLYKTGDLACFREDGNIEFLGRMDDQVKIRGFRIELGEIESVLNQFPGVKQSVVSVREDNPGDQRLVAYFCVQDKKGLDIDEIRSYMKKCLPEYMVPYAYVMLEAIPLTDNGKTDRKSLPEPDLLHSNKNIIIAPRTELEQQLCEIWKEILGQDQIGIDNNFFNIGGHSLLLTQVAARVHSILSVDVPFSAYFEAPTIAEMAVYITTLQAQDLAEDDLLSLLDELDDLPDDS